MARSDFGGTPGDTIWGERPDGTAYFTGGTITCWSAQTGGTQYTDLLLNGAAVTQIVVGDDAQIPVFQGPDGITSLWISADGGPRAILRAGGFGGGGSVTVTDNSNGTLTISGKTFYSKAGVDALLATLTTAITSAQAAIDVLQGTVANLPANAVLVVWNGSAWTYKGDVITARPTTDADYPVIALYGTVEPTWLISGTDAWLEDTGA